MTCKHVSLFRVCTSAWIDEWIYYTVRKAVTVAQAATEY